MRTRRHSTKIQECLPTARAKANHHHSCELVVGFAGYQCDVGMFPALELFRREKEKERRELKRLSKHLSALEHSWGQSQVHCQQGYVVRGSFVPSNEREHPDRHWSLWEQIQDSITEAALNSVLLCAEISATPL